MTEDHNQYSEIKEQFINWALESEQHLLFRVCPFGIWYALQNPQEFWRELCDLALEVQIGSDGAEWQVKTHHGTFQLKASR